MDHQKANSPGSKKISVQILCLFIIWVRMSESYQDSSHILLSCFCRAVVFGIIGYLQIYGITLRLYAY